MAVENDIAVLKQLALFQSLTDEQLRLLIFGAERFTCQRDEQLFAEGELATCAYVILNGAFHLYRHQANRDWLTGSADSGTMLNELALLTKTNRTFTAIAAQRSKVLKITREKFYFLMEEYPEISQHLYDYVSARMRELVDDISRIDCD